MIRKATRNVGISLIIVGVLCGTALCQYAAEFTSYRGGNRYDSRIARDELTKTPAWRDDEQNPPLSARRAELVAAEYLQHLFGNVDKWTLNEIALRSIGDRWVYAISFTEPAPPGVADHASSPFRIIVRMDGIAVPVRVSPYPMSQASSDEQQQLDRAKAQCTAWMDTIKSQYPSQRD